jgi:hypothetical protein
MKHGDGKSSGGRMQWGSYGFFAGVVVGVLIGWMFAGFIGALFRVAIVAAAVVPLVLLYILWRKVISPWLRPPQEPRYSHLDTPRYDFGYDYDYTPADAIETRAVVRGVAREPNLR